MSAPGLRALVATDGSDAAAHAARRAREMLPHADLALVAVMDEPVDAGDHAGGFQGPLMTPEEAEDANREARIEAEGALSATARALGPDPIEQHLRAGRPGDEICDAARELDADLVVVGSTGKGLAARALIGSVSTHVVQHCPVPVLVVRPEE